MRFCETLHLDFAMQHWLHATCGRKRRIQCRVADAVQVMEEGLQGPAIRTRTAMLPAPDDEDDVTGQGKGAVVNRGIA